MKHNQMTKDKTRRLAVTILTASCLFLLYVMIFGFSEQDGETSGGLSHAITLKCVEIINSFRSGKWTQDTMEWWATYFEHPVRKLAHFTEYAVMGSLIYILLRQWKQRTKWLIFGNILWVFVSAAFDEIHQLFVPDRYGSFADVCLDTLGGAFGVSCLILIEIWFAKRKEKIQKKIRMIFGFLFLIFIVYGVTFGA